jgi:hypothetical protein
MKVTVLRLKCDLGVRRYRASSAGSMTMPDGRLWLIRDAYTAETAWHRATSGRNCGTFDQDAILKPPKPEIISAGPTRSSRRARNE